MIRRRHTAVDRDRGMTLPELLIAVTVMGVITTALSGAIVVTLRQSTSTEGRINVARAEQSIGTWIPADLASTDVTRTDLPAVDTSPGASPCGNCTGLDMSGANALQLAWTTKVPGSPPRELITRVQYQYIQRNGEWQLQRIECTGSAPCSMSVVLHDLAAPPASGSAYNPDTMRPVWVMDVAAPQNPEELAMSDSARQVVVTVNGGGGADGAGGGTNSISLTAGGVPTGELAADDFVVPSFVRAKSRCGGKITLVVDDSGSIESAVDTVVTPGVEAFIQAFRGTPTEVQVIQFSSKAVALGAGTTDWHKYFDMTDDQQVDTLLAAVQALDSNGGTNWEEAFFHTLKNSDGTPASAVVDGRTVSMLPSRIVFFTDGVPTRNRLMGNSYRNGTLVNYNAGAYRTSSGWTATNGHDFHQESFDRADVILDGNRNIDLTFVGVGPSLRSPIQWIYNPAVYTNLAARPAAPQSKLASDAIAYLLADGPEGQVLADYDSTSGTYTNPEVADLYLQDSFDAAAFGAAMKASALKDCGGTLTVQTRFEDGTPVDDEFVYENVRFRDPTGRAIVADPRRITTSSVFRTGTFDFEIPAGVSYYDVDIVPQELRTLSDYTPIGWSCRAGANLRSTIPIPISASSWEGATVRVGPNEAVSCVLTVRSGQ